MTTEELDKALTRLSTEAAFTVAEFTKKAHVLIGEALDADADKTAVGAALYKAVDRVAVPLYELSAAVTRDLAEDERGSEAA